ncbi:MAG: protein kinase, partial [Planctomycetota bacterium]|nr:protein kinase [Planctomycetota bacterium]
MRCLKCGQEISDTAKFCPECGTAVFKHKEITFESADPERIFLERYIAVGELGHGAMGVVYLAKDMRLDEFIAMKMMPSEFVSDKDAIERMREETRLARSLRHENITAIYDFQIDRKKNACFITMEFVDGKDLGTMVRKEGKRFSAEEVLSILRQVAAALDYAHSKKIIHRDIKPKNIMVSKDGIVKVMDFGIAKRVQDSVSKVSQTFVMGTPGYMAPEHLLGEKIDHRIDVYSLGATVYEMLSGRPPYEGSYEQVLAQLVVKRKEVEKIEGLPESVNEVILKALAYKPEGRFSTAGEFYNAMMVLEEHHKEEAKKQKEQAEEKKKRKDAKRYYECGRVKHLEGDYDGAIEDYNKALELDPENADAYGNRGFARSATGDYDGAIKDFNKAIELSPTDALAYAGRGFAKAARGDYEGAIRDCDKAIEFDSKLVAAYVCRGDVKRHKKDYKGAIEDYSIAIELNPKDARLWGKRGDARYAKREYESALKDYNKAIELKPDYALAY